MGLLDLFRRKKEFVPAPSTNSNGNVVRLLSQQTTSFRVFGDRQLVSFYDTVAPCADALDFLAEASAAIEMKIGDGSEFENNAQVEAIIDNPNPVQNWHNIYLSLATFFLISGNSYVCVTRSSGGKMLELFVFEPQNITIETDHSLFVKKYHYDGLRGFNRLTFERQEIGSQIRYITRDGTKELYHLRRFNPHELQTCCVGTSKLQAVVYELAQDRAGSIHNLGILENGTRVGGLIKLREGMSKDQQANIIAQVDNKFTGARNAGRSVVSDAIEAYIDTMQSNRDMDFQNLKTAITERIYQRYKIPLALITSTSLSLANMTQAQFQFYHNSVIPLTKQIYSFLTDIFDDYFPSFQNQMFTFDPFTIDALRFRRLEELQMQATLNVTSDNEFRNKLDLEDYDGGDDVYKPSDLIPVGTIGEDRPDLPPPPPPTPTPASSPDEPSGSAQAS